MSLLILFIILFISLFFYCLGLIVHYLLWGYLFLRIYSFDNEVVYSHLCLIYSCPLIRSCILKCRL
jgi:hypothetical protein